MDMNQVCEARAQRDRAHFEMVIQEKNRIISELEERLKEGQNRNAMSEGLEKELRLIRAKYDNDMREK